MQTKEEVEAALKRLGERSCDVAASLREFQIKGKQGKCRECPIAVLLAKLGVSMPYVGSSYVELEASPGHPDASNWVDLPMPVRHFIDEFDRGQYRDLREEP